MARSQRVPTILRVAVLAVGLATTAAEAAPTWRLGARLGGLEPTNAQRSYDAVYGGVLPLLGVEAEIEVRGRLRLALSWEHGEVDGEQVLPTDPPRPIGVRETLTYEPLALTASWVLNPQRRWRVSLGGGLLLLSWEDRGSRTASGSDPGAVALLGVDRELGRWRLGLELRASTVPNAIGDAGISKLYGEDDLGGVGLHLRAAWRLGR